MDLNVRVFIQKCISADATMERPSSMAFFLHVFCDSERDVGGWVGRKWQLQRDVIIEQPIMKSKELENWLK